MNEITVVDNNALIVSEARIALRDSSVEEIKEIRDRAITAEVYAKAKQQRELYMAAGEIKLWAERAAGEVRRKLPRQSALQPAFDRNEARRLREQGLTQKEVGDRLGVKRSAIGHSERKGWKDGIKGVPIKEFDEELGVSSAAAYTWEKISDIPEGRFAELIEQAKEHDAALTARGILRRDGRAYETRVEPGIYRLRDGRLAIRWRKDGIARGRVLPHNDIVKARKSLAKARGQIKDTHVRVGKTIGDGYALVRRALQLLDQLEIAEFDAAAKEAVQTAVSHLHYAEDSLVIASRTGTRRRTPMS